MSRKESSDLAKSQLAAEEASEKDWLELLNKPEQK